MMPTVVSSLTTAFFTAALALIGNIFFRSLERRRRASQYCCGLAFLCFSFVLQVADVLWPKLGQ